MTLIVDGPAWAQQGLDQREGRYPLSVESPVLGMVAVLLPGVSTLTQFARYYALYWALAERAGRHDLDAAACRTLLRRAEVLLAAVTRERRGREIVAHGADALTRGRSAGRSLWDLAETGERSYSPRAWGFWSQYAGPSESLGTATTTDGALRPARHRCPDEVVATLDPLLDLASRDRPPDDGDLATLAGLALGQPGPDLDALRELFAATRGGRHVPDDWEPDDRTRRSTLRILLRAGQIAPDLDPVAALRRTVAFGATAADDPVLAAEDRTPAWRGLLLRHYSVGAWRRLWSDLVDQVAGIGVATRADLHAWIAERLPDERLRPWLDALPASVSDDGSPAPAEETVMDREAGPSRELAVLALGAHRRRTLTGPADVAFRGGRNLRPSFLDPEWVGRRIDDHRALGVRDLGRVLVDDMLAQSRRVAYRKVHVREGRLQMFSRLHERNDSYTTRSREGSGNVGLRIEQASAIAGQLGLVDSTVTALGADILDLR